MSIERSTQHTTVRTLIVGAGVSGLATAAALGHDHDLLILEAEPEIGGYCRTVKQQGFVWDYSGHFFHFKDPEIEAWLRSRMPQQHVRTVERRSAIAYAGRSIEFPFQKNIHQLPLPEFIECLHDLYFATANQTGSPNAPEASFKEMLYARYGRAIAEKFLIPYNEKLYGCDLATLDREAMGRFFPHADLAAVIRNMRAPEDDSYNRTFTYPEGGAIEYINALASEVRTRAIALEEPLLELDVERKLARTPHRTVSFERLISSVPLPYLAQLAQLSHDRGAFSWNKVLVFNLGFDAKGPTGIHWIYYPGTTVFYRVGFYDNIFDANRMSLYVEIGLAEDQSFDRETMLARVLSDLRSEGLWTDQNLVASHSVVLDPAYVHISNRSNAEAARLRTQLGEHDIYSIGRYGAWTYCSIEDNIKEARALVRTLQASA
jgi:protoporphyrinogen oxidase